MPYHNSVWFTDWDDVEDEDEDSEYNPYRRPTCKDCHETHTCPHAYRGINVDGFCLKKSEEERQKKKKDEKC